MARPTTLTITLDEDIAGPLLDAAKARGWSPEALIADCVAQHLEVAIRHRVLIERLEQTDAALVTLAVFVGEATVDRGQIDLSTICRYHGVGDET